MKLMINYPYLMFYTVYTSNRHCCRSKSTYLNEIYYQNNWILTVWKNQQEISMTANLKMQGLHSYWKCNLQITNSYIHILWNLECINNVQIISRCLSSKWVCQDVLNAMKKVSSLSKYLQMFSLVIKGLKV